MSVDSNFTKFAPAERASKEELKRQVDLFRKIETLEDFLGKIPAIFLIVNKYRQIVYMNKGALDFTGLESIIPAVGKRPGELFGCSHADEEVNGCGTSEACAYCGAVRAVMSSLEGVPMVQEAQLFLGIDEQAYDLRVWAAPLEVAGERFAAVTIQDIRHEKRRFLFERIFFHDIINTVSGLKSTLQIIMNYGSKVDITQLLNKLDSIINKLIDEIQSHRLLIEAENNELKLNLSEIDTLGILNEIIQIYLDFSQLVGNKLQINEAAEKVIIISDKTVLRRIIGNAVKNAIEATPKGGIISVGCKRIGDRVQFWIHNPGFIPRDLQLQIFQKSFSTKQPGRGLGTYSMKLLSRFLDGEVSFTTSEQKGTTFFITFPIELKKR